jgi:hypothetical protein
MLLLVRQTPHLMLLGTLLLVVVYLQPDKLAFLILPPPPLQLPLAHYRALGGVWDTLHTPRPVAAQEPLERFGLEFLEVKNDNYYYIG